MKRAIVVGSGAGGATAARELAGHFDVTVLEAGGPFRRFGMDLGLLEPLRATGLLFDERLIQLLYPAFRIQPAGEMVLVCGRGAGGTTTLATGNALRADADLRALGIDLDVEFEELGREVPITTAHQGRWRPSTRRLFEVCREMGLDPEPTPKMGDYGRCARCGRCVMGCPHGVKWDARAFLEDATARGARLVTGSRAQEVVIEGGKAVGVRAREGWATRFHPADAVVLAAGGLGTPAILGRSGIECEERLFVDPVLCVAAEWKSCAQNLEIPMPFVVQRERYIVSPYIDLVSFFFNPRWRLPGRDLVSLMIKLADDDEGRAGPEGARKALTEADRARLDEAAELCREILAGVGIRREDTFLGTLNAGHPGGALPLTEAQAESLHDSRLPGNLYVVDATLLPRALGNPPILTIMALARRVSRACAERLA